MDNKNIKNIFNTISVKYDLANFLMSLGLEKYWRCRFDSHIDQNTEKALDACCGTGVSTFNIYKRTLQKSKVYGIDFSEEMLSVAREKLKNLKYAHVFFKMKDIKKTGFEDNFFDLASIVFGIRNVQERPEALKELYRITKPSGKILIMEFSYPQNKLFQKIYSFYLDKILVNIGAALTRNRDAYAHLASSIKSFPKVDDFIGTLNDCGWTGIRNYNHSFSTCIIYEAFKK